MRVEKITDLLHIYLEEKNYPDSSAQKKNLLSKGFLPEITIRDFPIRDKKVFLHIKRRRWLNTETGKVEQRDWQAVSSGTRMTADFAAFFRIAEAKRSQLIIMLIVYAVLDKCTGLMVNSFCAIIGII